MVQVDADELKLTDLIDAAALAEILEVFATVTHTTVNVCDPQGRGIARSSHAHPICELMVESDQGREACSECIAAVVRRAVGASAPVSLDCHAGMVEYAAPVTLSGQVLAVIVMGDLPRRQPEPATVGALAERYQLAPAAVAAVFESMPPWSEDEMSAALGFLQLLADTLSRFCQQESRLRHRVEELTTVYEMTAMLAGTRDLDEVLRIAARNVATVLRVKACSIRLLDPSTGELKIAAGYNLSPEYLNKGPVKLSENPIDKAAIEGRTVTMADVTNDPRIRYPAQAKKEGLVSGMVTGMVFRGQPVGVIRVYTGERHAFSAFEVSLLRAVAAQAAAAIENTRLTAEAIRSEIVDHQIKMAAQVQRRMVPDRPPAHAHLEFGSVYEPTYDLAGDFYDFLELDDGLTGLAIADVVGKGVAAGLMMASVRSALRVWANGLGPLDEIIGKVNRQLCRDTLPGEFTTLFYGVFSPDGRRLTYCNAGHDPPVLVREGTILRLETGGMLLGATQEATYESASVDLQPDDVILFYTDGVVGAMNFADECFGRDRLNESLVRYAVLRGSAIAANVLWDVRRFVGLVDQIDDITMVSVKVLP